MPITLNGDTGILTPMYNGAISSNAVTPVVGMKNKIINGAMVIDQRNAGASVNNAASANTFPVDRFAIYGDSASKISGQRSTTSIAGFVNSLLLTSLAATTPSSTDFYGLRQNIEGFNVADLGWGTANAKTVTLSFWVRSSLTGTFNVAFSNNAANRAYVASYTISSANTFEYKTITIAGDTTGTWATDNSVGIGLWWDLGSGSSRAITGDSWSGTYGVRTSGSVSLNGTNGATFYITGVQLEVGSTATSFDYRPYGTELALCQRYFQRDFQGTFGQAFSSTDGVFTLVCAVPMRANPTLSQASGVSITIDVIGGSQNATSQSIGGAGQSTTRTPLVVSGLTGRTTNQGLGISNTGTQLSAEL